MYHFRISGAVGLLMLLVCLSGAWSQEESGGVRENDITRQGQGRESRVREAQIESQVTEATEMTQTTGQTTATPDMKKKCAVLQRQLCHQSPWVRAQALS